MNAEEFLVNLCSAMGLDCSELSPFRRYVIRPVAQMFQSALDEAAKVQKTVDAILKNSPQEADPVVLESLLALFGLSAQRSTPTTGKIKLVPSAARAFHILSKEYEDGEVSFVWEGHTFYVKGFVAGSVGVADFYCDDPNAYVPPGTVVPLSHPDFSEGVVLACEKGKTASFDVLKYVTERLERATFAATEKDIKSAAAKDLLLDEKSIYVVGANHPLMFSDLSESGEHMGGFVDVYVPAVHVDVVQQVVAKRFEVLAAQLPERPTPFPIKAASKKHLPVDDTNVPKSFLSRNFDALWGLQAALLEGPVSDVIFVEVSGKRLRENEDYVVLTLDRGKTFSEQQKLAVVFAKDLPQSGAIVSCSMATIPVWDVEKHRFVCATYTTKAKVPVWIEGEVDVSGEVDWTALQRELSEMSSITEGDFVLLLKKHGAKSVSVRRLWVKLVSLGFGTFKRDLPVDLSDFSFLYPKDVLQLCVTKAHLAG
ncbi:MAG: hypothetical protein QW650_00295 [Thermofilum sp.]